jgi:hypothetical protein
MERCEYVAQMERQKFMTSSPRHYGKKQLGNSVIHGRIKRKWEI